MSNDTSSTEGKKRKTNKISEEEETSEKLSDIINQYSHPQNVAEYISEIKSTIEGISTAFEEESSDNGVQPNSMGMEEEEETPSQENKSQGSSTTPDTKMKRNDEEIVKFCNINGSITNNVVNLLKINEDNLLKHMIIRECYKEIYYDIVSSICESQQVNSGLSFQPQCCFLIYGNSGVGKSTLCLYLSYMFTTTECFDGYDIIVYSEECKAEESYLIRKGKESGKSTFISGSIPPKVGPTIVISDNVAINEDDFSEDDIVIFISSPQAECYKVFRNKREPIVYYIPQLKGEELNDILTFYNKRCLFNKAIRFGGNLNSTTSGYELDEKIEINKMEELFSYIPGTYKENVFIYDTDKFNGVPKHLRFLSDEIEKLYFTHFYNDQKYCKMLFDVYDKYEERRIFERLVHMLLTSNVNITIVENRNLNTMPCNNKKIVYVEKNDMEKIFEPFEKEQTKYVDFTCFYSFPTIDGCYINNYAIYGVKITLRDKHPTKDNAIVYFTVYI